MKNFRYLVEEYITQQKSGFTLKGICSNIFYWAVEDGRVDANNDLIESNELHQDSQKRVEKILETIEQDGRIQAIIAKDRAYKIQKN